MRTKRNARRHRKPFHTTTIDWIPISDGLSFKPITYFPDDTGWQLLLRLEPGTVVTPHRHTGEVHAFNLAGARLLINSGELVGPGAYVYEPAGNCDTWKAVGDEPCIIHVEVNGAIEYLDERGEVTRVSDARASRKMYEEYCAARGRPVDAALSG